MIYTSTTSTYFQNINDGVYDYYKEVNDIITRIFYLQELLREKQSEVFE